MATVSTVISTNLNLVSDYSKRFYKVAPTKFPTATFGLVNTGAPMNDIYVRWGNKTTLQTSTQINYASGYSNSDTSIVVDSTEGMRSGQLVFVPRTGEIFRITTVTNTTTLGVIVRGVTAETGGVAAALVDNDTLIVLSTPVDESFAYSNAPSALMYSPADIYNQMQTFVEPINISGRTLELIKRGVLKYQEVFADKQADAMELVKQALNRSLLFQGSATKAGSDGVNTKTGGIRWNAVNNGGSLNSSVGDLSNPLTFENAIKTTCLWAGTNQMMMTCSPTALQSIQRLYQGGNIGAFTGQVLEMVGVQVHRITTPWGVSINCYLDYLLEDYYDNTNSRYLGQFLLWDPKDVKWRPNRPLGRYRPPQTADVMVEYIMGEGGWELGPGKKQLVGIGVTPITA